MSLFSCGPDELFPIQDQSSGQLTNPRTAHFSEDFGKPIGVVALDRELPEKDKKDQVLLPMDPEGIGLTPEDFD